jgi:glycine/D-amino acid oxidase-like deaminating enzyme
VKEPDVAIIGAGIVGCAAAVHLAEGGAAVAIFEATAIGAGASGRNLGAVQHPFDPVLSELHQATVATYRELAAAGDGFSFPSEPAGLLLLTADHDTAERRADELGTLEPQLDATALDPDALVAIEPILAHGFSAVRLATGYRIPPEAATSALARRARAAGAGIEVGRRAAPIVDAGRCTGVKLDDGSRVAAGTVLVAAGPWTADVGIPGGAWRPMAPTHGVTVQVALPTPAQHVLEEGVVHTINRPVEAPPDAADDWQAPPSLFSLVSAGPVTTIGSTFLPSPPDVERTAPLLVERGAAFVPALRDVRVLATRICARPQSLDGRPFLGPVPGVEGLWVCAGHGPWGISTGPGTARLLADAMLRPGRQPIPAELDVARTFAW